MDSVLEKYASLLRQNNIESLTLKSQEWFLGLLNSNQLDIGNKNRPNVLNDPFTKKVSRPRIGKMYTFMYDAKTKDVLPYWDKFPLIILADIPEDAKGFFGLNLHYLQPEQRAIFFRKLANLYSSGDLMNENTKIRISYEILKSIKTLRAFRPMFKRYLPKQVKTPIVEIPPAYWETALFLPTQRFVGASQNKVWADSRKQLR